MPGWPGYCPSWCGGDFARDYDDVVRGMSAYFAWANRNKESVALDLKHPVGREALARLVRRADVVVQNLAPGAAARLGLDPAELRAAHPELITVDISGFGKGGPYAQGGAYDLLIQAEAGSCAITGAPGQPAKPGIPLADIGAGMYALSSILAALFVRERTGEGTAISVGLFDSVAEWLGYALNLARYGGFDLEPNGVSSPAVAPYGAYTTADEQTLVLGTTNDREWRRLALEVLHRPDLADDPRYAHNRDRVAHRAELDAVIGEWAAGLSLAECRKAAEAAGLGHARLNRRRHQPSRRHRQAGVRHVPFLAEAYAAFQAAAPSRDAASSCAPLLRQELERSAAQGRCRSWRCGASPRARPGPAARRVTPGAGRSRC